MHSCEHVSSQVLFLGLASSFETRQKFCHIYLLYDNGLEWLRGDLVCPDPTVTGYSALAILNGDANRYDRVVARGEGLARA
jgi:hypothetical protein